jgi:hypothetical protein
MSPADVKRLMILPRFPGHLEKVRMWKLEVHDEASRKEALYSGL